MVRAERHRRQSGPTVEITVGIVQPGVTHSQWLRDFFARNDHRIALNSRIRWLPFFIRPGDGKTFQTAVVRDQSAVGVCESNFYFRPIDF